MLNRRLKKRLCALINVLLCLSISAGMVPPVQAHAAAVAQASPVTVPFKAGHSSAARSLLA
ncbi:MAG: hypothetical protein PVF45_15185, partial [Anaerolineae bacterium]